MRTLKIIGFAIGLLGLVAVLLDQYGVFQNKEKICLAALIRDSNRVPRDSPGFDSFVARFPPPSNIRAEEVDFILMSRVQWADGFPAYISVSYEARGTPTKRVASFDDVRRWSEETPYSWIGLTIAFTGWLVGVVSEVLSRKKQAI